MAPRRRMLSEAQQKIRAHELGYALELVGRVCGREPHGAIAVLSPRPKERKPKCGRAVRARIEITTDTIHPFKFA
jgi:hypothetical protein